CLFTPFPPSWAFLHSKAGVENSLDTGLPRHDRLGPRWRNIAAGQSSHPRPQRVNGTLCCFLLLRRQCLQLRIELGLLLLQKPDQTQGRLRSRLVRQLPRQRSLEGTCAVASVARGDGGRKETGREIGIG